MESPAEKSVEETSSEKHPADISPKQPEISMEEEIDLELENIDVSNGYKAVFYGIYVDTEPLVKHHHGKGDVNVVYFALGKEDGLHVYRAVEDEYDGYRSYLPMQEMTDERQIYKVFKKLNLNQFPIQIICVEDPIPSKEDENNKDRDIDSFTFATPIGSSLSYIGTWEREDEYPMAVYGVDIDAINKIYFPKGIPQ